MTRRGEFFEIDDPFAPEVAEQVGRFADLTADDMGAVRATFRSWPSTTAWVVGAVVVVGALLVPVAGTSSAAGAVRLAVAGSVVFWLGVLVAAGAVERNRVCEHGLVLGYRTRSRYVVPWSTVDPGRVRVVRRPMWWGRQPDGPGVSPHYRVGILGSRALAVNGLDTAVEGWRHVPGFTRVSDARDPGGSVRVTPFVWWMLGTQRPERMAREIEAAMVADGYPAAGLAERAQRLAVTMPFLTRGRPPLLPSRMGTDRVVGVDGPGLP